MKSGVTKEQLHSLIDEAYAKYKSYNGGKNADYIPYLAKVDSELFGIAACLPDGQIIQVGDCAERFGIESISKVMTAILILKLYGAETILDMIGADATGMPFNSIMAILLENNHPSTPLVNAGAIAAVSLVQPVGNKELKWEAIISNMQELCDAPLPLIDELYKSESAGNYNNRSIAWLLKHYNRIYDEPELSLDLYTRQCSVSVTARELAICGATIANDGINPVSKKRIFSKAIAPKITAMLASVGFYEHTGDWMFTSGLPAKSGVGGGIMGVLPGGFGIATFSPPLDASGNSVKGQKALRYIMQRLDAGIYNSN